MPLPGGAELDHYRIISPLGAGGMGEVYLAEDLVLGRQVAIKVLPDHLTRDPERVRRFEREARAASALNHPNIVTIYELGRSPAGRFIAMELVRGRTLREVAGRTPLESVAAIGRQLAEALRAAHEVGIAHRDLKPENVMVRDDGYVKVLDFGLAVLAATEPGARDTATALSGAGLLIGTVPYMSPEQARGDPATTASDIFAMGIVLYELATGRHPFSAASPLGTLHAIVTETPIAPSAIAVDAPPPLSELILRMLQKAPADRPAAGGVEQALSDLSRTVPAAAGARAAARSARPTVGREAERAELGAAFDAVDAGRGLLLSIGGEPGSGKTTLVEDFLAGLPRTRPCAVARGRCSERLAGTDAYLPWLDALGNLLHSSSDGSPGRAMKALAPSWYFQVAGAGDPAAAAARAERAAMSKEALTQELIALLQELTRARPLVFFFDDLHWADVSTIELLMFVADRFDQIRLLAIVTYRPSDLFLTQHPFLKVKPGLQARGACRDLALAFLTRADVDRYLELEYPGHRFPADLAAQLHARTEGSPLFLADLTRYLRQRGAISQPDGVWTLSRPLREIDRDLPESVRAMIERIIAQLSDDDRKLVLAASVLGDEFDTAPLARALGIDAAAIEERVEVLGRLHVLQFVGEREFPDHTPTLRYRFVHVLYQNVLFDSLKPTRRTQLASALAGALEACWGPWSAGAANELARLFQLGREYGRAAECYRRAARAALQVFAGQEAAVLAQQALAMNQKRTDDPGRTGQELAIQVVLANALLTHGGAAPEVERACARAAELCGQAAGTPDLLAAYWGLGALNLMRARHRAVLDTRERFLGLLERNEDPALVVAHIVMGQAALFCGRLEDARSHLEQSLARSVPPERLPLLYGVQPGVSSHLLLALTLWLLGFPDRARHHAREGVNLGRGVDQPGSRFPGLLWEAVYHQFRRDWPRVGELGAAITRLWAGHGSKAGLALGLFLEGLALSHRGSRDATGPAAGAAQDRPGTAAMRRGLAAYEATGAGLMQSMNRCLLAEACLAAGEMPEAHEALREAGAAISGNDDRLWDAEFHRVSGEVRLADGDEPGAELSFQTALAIATSQRARSLELRAAMSLGRLLLRQGRRDDATALVGGVHAWFSEGRDTADLREAQRWLAAARTA